MKLFRSGIRALLRDRRALSGASLVIGMPQPPPGFDAPPSNFPSPVVRVAQPRFLSFRNAFRLGSTALVAVALGACGGGGGGSTTSNSTTPPPPTKYTIGGSVSGLTGTGLVLQNNGGDNLAVSASGTFTFATSLNAGASYAVTVMTQPSGQTCTVANGSGTANANVTNVGVTCAATTQNVTVGGTVAGLAGAGLVLMNNGGDALTVSANGNFTFATSIVPGTVYAVTVSTQPTGPAQRCTVASGGGTASANVSSVAVTCLTTGQFLYTANNGDGTITGFTISPTTGQLTAIAGNPVADGGAGTAPAAVSLSPNGKFAFSASNQGKQIYAFTINSTTGVLTPTPHSPFNTGFAVGHPYPDIAVDPQSKFLYLASLNDNEVVGFSIDQTTGDLTSVGAPSPAGEGAGAIPAFSPDGKFLYVMNQNPPVGMTSGNSVSVYSINQTSGALTEVTGSPFSTGGTNPTWISFRPDGKFAYVANSNNGSSSTAGTVSVFSVNTTTGALTVQGSPVPAENWPSDLTIDAAGTHLYVPNRASHSISEFSIDATTGALTNVGTAGTGLGPQLVVIEPTGKYAYVSSSYANDVYGYSIDPASGVLTALSGNPFVTGASGAKPLFINIDNSGQFAYTANNGTAQIAGFTIDPSTGALTSLGTPVTTGNGPFVVSISPELPGIRD